MTKLLKERVSNTRTSCKTSGGKGSQAWLFPVKAGCRGFPAQSDWRMLTETGMTGKETKTKACRMGESAESCIWKRREGIHWKPARPDGQ